MGGVGRERLPRRPGARLCRDRSRQLNPALSPGLLRPSIESPGTGSGDGPYTGPSAARVYRVVRALPAGRATTYGTIARLLGL
ncbi:MGMT family protein, partial [bacterium]